MKHEIVRNSVGAIRHIRTQQNSGKIEVDVSDDRFLIDSYDYVSNRSFTKIEDAVTSEIHILRLAASDAFTSTSIGSRYVSSLKNLVNVNSNSQQALRAKIERLEADVQQYQSLYKSAGIANKKLERRINALRWESSVLKDTLNNSL